jgi:hypothetical protein
MEAQGIEEERRIRPYTASSRFSKDVESLHKIGMTSEEISYSLSVPVMFVQKQEASIAQASEERRKFLSTGMLPNEFEGRPGVFSILQK